HPFHPLPPSARLRHRALRKKVGRGRSFPSVRAEDRRGSVAHLNAALILAIVPSAPFATQTDPSPTTTETGAGRELGAMCTYDRHLGEARRLENHRSARAFVTKPVIVR